MLALDPNETIEISLVTDENKPAESRPIFIARYLTYSQSIQYGKLIRLAVDESEDDKAVEHLRTAFKLALVNWKNVGREFAPDSITEFLTAAECWELAHEIPYRVRVNQQDKKKSLLRSPTDAEKSVTSAGMENATTNPAPTAQ